MRLFLLAAASLASAVAAAGPARAWDGPVVHQGRGDVPPDHAVEVERLPGPYTIGVVVHGDAYLPRGVLYNVPSDAFAGYGRPIRARY